MVRDTRKIGTDDWASRFEKVTQGQNNNPIEEYLEGMPSSNVRNSPELVRVLKEKNASYSDLNHNRMEKRAQRLEDTGQFRIMESTGGKFTRGFKPKFGEVRKVQDIQGPRVINDKNKNHLTKLVLPVSETTEDRVREESSKKAVSSLTAPEEHD